MPRRPLPREVSVEDLHDEELLHVSSLYSSAVASRRGSPGPGARGQDPLLELRSLLQGSAAQQARETPVRAEAVEDATPASVASTPASQPPPPPPPALAMAETCWCFSLALETALFRLCALDLAPMGALLIASMEASAKEVAYFITDTAAYIVSKMWDDMLSSEVFHTSTAFLCSDEYGRPCNRPAAIVIQ
jgi:hypothetical protein